MKYLILVIISIIVQPSMAQTNLVPNPSFEDTVQCPIGPNELNEAVGWISFAGSPDYMNKCSSSSMSVPNNWAGYQPAASGQGYAAIATYSTRISCSDCREYAGIQLSTPLTIGVKYYVSFKVALSLYVDLMSNCASNKLGAAFSTLAYDVLHPAPVTNSPQIHSNTIITDTLNWTRVFGSFVADSVYEYIMIGNFFSDNNTDTLILDGDSLCNAAYYFLDDVCVSTDSTYSAEYNYQSINEIASESPFLIYPNPANNIIAIKNTIESEPYDLVFFNALGEKVLEINRITLNQYQLNISELKNGIYYITIRTKKNQFNSKLIKT